MGRKPINGVAMTGSERQRRHRAKSKQDRDANAHRLRAYRLERLLLRTLRELRAMERHLTERGIEPYKRGDLKLGVNRTSYRRSRGGHGNTPCKYQRAVRSGW